jgi:hypothetical protein
MWALRAINMAILRMEADIWRMRRSAEIDRMMDLSAKLTARA